MSCPEIDTCQKEIKDELGKKVSTSSIRNAIYASLFILVAIFGVFTTMWAQTNQIPKLEQKSEEQGKDIVIAQKDIAILKTQMDYLVANSQTIIDLLKEMQKEQAKRNGQP
jgi:hypothetical protein